MNVVYVVEMVSQMDTVIVLEIQKIALEYAEESMTLMNAVYVVVVVLYMNVVALISQMDIVDAIMK